MGKMRKAIMALLGGAATIAGHFGLNIDPEIVATVGTVATTALVYFVPNAK